MSGLKPLNVTITGKTGGSVPPTIGPDLDMGREYFCIMCEHRHDGKECPSCKRMATTLADEMFMKEVDVTVRHKIFFRKGSLKRITAMINPRQHVIGTSEELGDYRLQATGVIANGDKS